MRGRLPRVGKYTGDGSTEQTIDLGWQPQYVKIVNITDGDVTHELLLDAADGTTKHLETKDSGAASTDLSIVSSNAAAITSRGFRTGTDADIIESAKVYYWVAF